MVDTSKTTAIELTVDEIMLKAADMMMTFGWNNNSRMKADGTVCVLGAIELAIGMRKPHETWSPNVRDDSTSLGVRILPAIARKLGLSADHGRGTSVAYACALANWSNNSNGPTVISALRKAATQRS